MKTLQEIKDFAKAHGACEAQYSNGESWLKEIWENGVLIKMKLYNYIHKKQPLVSACSSDGAVSEPPLSLSDQKRNVEQWASRNKVIMTWDFNKFMQNQHKGQ